MFAVASKQDCVADLFYGTDYHSHLGTVRGGLVVKNGQGLTRFIKDITNAQFRAFVEAGGYRERRYWAEAERAGVWKNGRVEGFLDEPREVPYDFGEPFNLPNHPVVGVTWYEALAFCRWLEEKLRMANGRMGKWRIWREGRPETLGSILDNRLRTAIRNSQFAIRLPSEAEWEKAARGPALSLSRAQSRDRVEGSEVREYPWGDSWREGHCNFRELDVGDTTPVGIFPEGASPYGALELAGNVWEWTRSLWGKDWREPEYKYPYRPGDGRENLDAGDAVWRVLRGGSWLGNLRNARCAYRDWDFPDSFHYTSGFRLVVSLVSFES